MNNLIIRDALPADQSAIHDVTLAAYEQYANALGEFFWGAYKADMESTLAEPSPAAQIIAEQAGMIVGTVLLYPAGTAFESTEADIPKLQYPEIRLLAVSPSARGQGIGLELTRACMQRARNDGASGIALHTTLMMQAAKHMYEKIGFVRTPETDFEVTEDLTILGYRFDFDGK